MLKILCQEGFGIFGVEGDVGLDPLLDDVELRSGCVEVDHFGCVGFMFVGYGNGEWLGGRFYTTIRAAVVKSGQLHSNTPT